MQAEITDMRSTARAGLEATPPMVVQASALLLGQGKLETEIEIPLTATRFDMKYSGSLGPMGMLAFNAYAARVMPVRVTSGTMQAVRFSVVVRNGRSAGQVVPLYQDFKVALEDKKAKLPQEGGAFRGLVPGQQLQDPRRQPGQARRNPEGGPDQLSLSADGVVAAGILVCPEAGPGQGVREVVPSLRGRVARYSSTATSTVTIARSTACSRRAIPIRADAVIPGLAVLLLIATAPATAIQGPTAPPRRPTPA